MSAALLPLRCYPRPVLAILRVAALALACAWASSTMAQASTSNASEWNMLSADQKNLLAPFAHEWNEWQDSERKAWLALSERFPAMTPASQLRARERIRQWAQLAPEAREVARATFGVVRRLPRDKRVEQWHRYRNMTPEQRSVLREHGHASTTAAGSARVRTGLATEAAQPLRAEPPGPVLRPALAAPAGPAPEAARGESR